MKKVVLAIAISMSFPACSLVKELRGDYGNTAREQHEIEEGNQKSREAVSHLLANSQRDRKEAEQTQETPITLRPGLTASKVEASWGEPDQTEFVNGNLVYRYNNEDELLILTFRKDKLIGWRYDKAEAQRLAAIKELKAERRRREALEKERQRSEQWNQAAEMFMMMQPQKVEIRHY